MKHGRLKHARPQAQPCWRCAVVPDRRKRPGKFLAFGFWGQDPARPTRVAPRLASISHVGAVQGKPSTRKPSAGPMMRRNLNRENERR
eukprot:scaffold1804_cov263-Pinguiococcus_pyrenoidosus.AAC.5